MKKMQRMGILVGGGPAPGINSVIAAATIRARLAGIEVVGIPEGFRTLIDGEDDAVYPLEIDTVSRIHFRGGSILGISRANPTRDAREMEAVGHTLERLGIDSLVTIGGDDTAFSAMRLAERAAGSLRIAHVPKTIDNDLDLPPHIDTFGFQTARELGADLVRNLMVDAYTTSRWYFVVAMGRKAGHLALGIGKAAGATMTLIPEELPSGHVPLATVRDILAGSIIKRLSQGKRHGVAVLAEGIALSIDPDELAGAAQAERDAHGHVRLAEIALGDVLKRSVRDRLTGLGVRSTIVSKDIGYELRCADPVPADAEYTRDLGFCAVQFLLEGGANAMTTMQGGQFVAVPFDTMLDPDTGRTRVRVVDTNSTRYRIARRYMIRLFREDFTDGESLTSIAESTNLSAEEFDAQFGQVTDFEPPPLGLLDGLTDG